MIRVGMDVALVCVVVSDGVCSYIIDVLYEYSWRVCRFLLCLCIALVCVVWVLVISVLLVI